MTLTRLMLDGYFMIYFIEFSIKSISQQPVTSYNTSIIEPISMDSPQMISGVFGI